MPLPLTPCDDAPRPQSSAPSRSTSYPAPAPRVECPWVAPAAWFPGAALVQGSRVVITGNTANSRVDLMDRAVRAGLEVKNSVSRRTTVLVCNDVATGTHKLSSARKHGIPVVTEVEFERLLCAVAVGIRKGAVAPAPRVLAVRPRGPFSRRRILVLGGPHEAAVAVRSAVVERGGTAAVNLTTTTTDVVALTGAERDPRWARAQELRIPLLDPSPGTVPHRCPRKRPARTWWSSQVEGPSTCRPDGGGRSTCAGPRPAPTSTSSRCAWTTTTGWPVMRTWCSSGPRAPPTAASG